MQLANIDLNKWNDTKDDVQKILKVMSAIKSVHSPAEHFWQEHALVLSTQMVTTDVFPITKSRGFDLIEIEYDPIDQMLFISTQDNSEEVPVDGQSQQELFAQIKEALLESDIELNDEVKNDLGTIETEVDTDSLQEFWKSLQFADGCPRFLKSNLREDEVSNVNLWAHNFDISFTWLSNLATGEDSKLPDEKYHNMTFGFSAGDSSVPEPYFYCSFNKWNDKLTEINLESNAFWNNKNWNGAVLKLSDVYNEQDKFDFILNFYTSLNKAFKETIQ